MDVCIGVFLFYVIRNTRFSGGYFIQMLNEEKLINDLVLAIWVQTMYVILIGHVRFCGKKVDG